MGYRSAPEFVAMHALRIKGFATTDTIAEIAAQPAVEANGYLVGMESSGLVRFREGRDLWQLTPEGRAEHLVRLQNEVADSGAKSHLERRYPDFLEINGRFKLICTDWQVRGGEINDHADGAYDQAVISRLLALHDDAIPLVVDAAQALERLGPYQARLDGVLGRLSNGDHNMFTGVMCGSYHDVWMELHEDLILTQGIDRAIEGSF